MRTPIPVLPLTLCLLAPIAEAQAPPSEVATEGLARYSRSDYGGAAEALSAVVDGQTQDSVAVRAWTELTLAKSFARMGLPLSAMAVFDGMTREHPRFLHALPWLARIEAQVPEAANLALLVGRYSVDEIQRAPLGAGDQDTLLFLHGRNGYAGGQLDEAITAFRKIHEGSPRFAQARILEGACHVRLHRAEPAVAAFRAVIEGLEQGSVAAPVAEARMLNLARLSLARVLYSAANQEDDRTGWRTTDGRLLGAAVETWRSIPESSEYWLDSLFESSWALFLADRHGRALGNLHTLRSPYFEGAPYPEAVVLRAIAFALNCQIPNIVALADQFHQRFAAPLAELREERQARSASEDMRALAESVSSGAYTGGPRTGAMLAHALSDRELLAELAFVDWLGAQEEHLHELRETLAPATFDRALQDLLVARALAEDRAGYVTGARVDRLIEEIQERMNQIEDLHTQIATPFYGSTLESDRVPSAAPTPRAHNDIVVDEEHQVWPFNGEFWRDELGTYRHRITNYCGRR